MKILLSILFCCTLIFSILNLSGCTREDSQNAPINKRIILKESAVLDGHGFYIISVDGREFISDGGGVYPLDK